MEEKLDLSLDDIIKMNKNKGPRNQRDTKPNLQRLRNLGARSGIIRKGGPKQINRQQNSSSTNTTLPKKGPVMLHVSNLHYNVSNDDVRELFSEIGTIKRAAVHYDKSGRSLGTAEVIFTDRDSAIRAIKKYHQLPLDGRPMSITLVPSQTSVSRSPAKSRIGVKPGSGIYKRPQNKNNTRGGAPTNKGRVANAPRGNKAPQQKQRGRGPKKEVTAEDLDADLESYKMNIG